MDGWKKIQLIFGLAELLRKLENLAKIRLITNICSYNSAELL